MRAWPSLLLSTAVLAAAGCGGDRPSAPPVTTTAGGGIAAYAELQRYGRELEEGCGEAGAAATSLGYAVELDVAPALRRGDTAKGVETLRRELVLAYRRLRRGLRVTAGVRAPARFRALERTLARRLERTEAAVPPAIDAVRRASPAELARLAQSFDPDAVGFGTLRFPTPLGRISPSCPPLFDGPAPPPPAPATTS